MKLTDNGGKEFEQPPIGNHVARCIGMIDLGTQQGDYQGKTTHARKIVLRWELPNELISEGEWAGKPFVVSQFYTASLSEKANLRKVLESWRGKPFTPEELMGFDSKNLLDKPCMLNVTHTDKGKAKVASVAQVPKGMTVPGRVNDLLYFSLEPADFKRGTFDGLPKFFQEMIQKSPEWADLHGAPRKTAEQALAEMESDIPF
jgi:hypothetical protein